MTQEKEKPTAPPKRKLIIIAASVIIILLISGSLILFFNRGDNSLIAEGITGNSPSDEEKKLNDIGSIEMYGLSDFIVNLADDNARRYLKAVVYLGFDDQNLLKELEQREPEIRNVIINILRRNTSSDLKKPEITKDLRQEIMGTLNEMLISGELKSVFFWDFIVQ